MKQNPMHAVLPLMKVSSNKANEGQHVLGESNTMAGDGGSTKRQQHQLLQCKQKQLLYKSPAPELTIRQLDDKHSAKRTSADLENGAVPPSHMQLWPRSEQKQLDYNAPLLSIRRLNSRHNGNNSGTALRDNPGHSQKLSAELTCDFLRVPGEVPFVWELAPGLRKVSNDNQNTEGSGLQQCSADADNMDKQLTAHSENTTSLDRIFRDSSIESGISGNLSSHAVTASSARFSVRPRSNEDDDASSDAAFTTATDAFTTACGVSTDDCEGGPLDSQTSNDDRSFIMHRFLPAAHAIAHDSPQTPSQRSPAAFSPSPLINNRNWHSGPLHPPRTNYSAPIRLPASQVLRLHGRPHCVAHHEPPLKTHGILSFRFLKIFLSLHRELWWFKTKRSKARGFFSSSRFGDIFLQDESTDEDQDVVARQVQVDAQKKRAHRVMERVRPSVTVNGSSFHELVQFREAETLIDSASQTSVFNPGKNGATASLFVEGQGFLGLPKENYLKDADSDTDGSASYFETPRRSMSTSKLVEIDAHRNEYESASSRITSFFSRLHRTAGPEQRSLGSETPFARFSTRMISPGNAPTLPNSTSQLPDHRRNGDSSDPEKNPRPTLTNSPCRFCETKKRPETYFSAPLLSPPLPKSPSDSWLGKAIPVKSSSKLSPLCETEKVPLEDSFEPSATWEALVKESRFQAGRLRYQGQTYDAAKAG